ncbi:Capsule assembly protein Wzi [Bryocella elongata]|uniref:Capsule assembly protein Wzi n=1 Tax=Bryocella elongata TaxID=863522 RepID=A0A1H5UTS3_9BACT|nr:capsule assembly Wzi family protein [Bryocella elongata]SEF78463.1 Capsule assembly protein Wzi [Bryocella elongata]
MKAFTCVVCILAGIASSNPAIRGQSVTANASNNRSSPILDVIHDRARPGCVSQDNASSVDTSYIPMDSWIYPALDRLQALGYLDSGFEGLRPWTRLSISHMLECTAGKINAEHGDQEAARIYLAVQAEIQPPQEEASNFLRPRNNFESAYVRLGGVAGTPLRDSFHLGQTIANDYGRPYQSGFDPIAGFSTRSQAGRFSLYFRSEYQHAPDAPGYSPSLTSLLSTIDGIPLASNPNQPTIPSGPIAAANDFRIIEATLSYRLFQHEISFGKTDHWLGPGQGGSFAGTNNAESIYTFQIDRVEPLHVPWLSTLTGPFRYEFFVGSLKGHTDPNVPWFHLEKISFKPTSNLEMGFERGTIWGGEGHTPITVHSFLHSFFSFQNVPASEKQSRNDPGARFGSFDFSYRLPFVRNWLTLYSDSLVHDDVSPIDAPRHAGIRPGLYLSHFPHAPHLDMRVEAASTDPATGRSTGGSFLYTEYVEKQGYTNKGFIMGDAIGRESKGGQAWLTYHLSPRENVQFSYRNAKAENDFIPGGTTQNIFQVNAVKRLRKDFELRGTEQYERWKAPVYQTGPHSDASVSMQITWFARR